MRHGERHPPRLRDVAAERLRAAEGRIPERQSLPQRPGAGARRRGRRRGGHRAQRRAGGHRAQRDDHQVARRDVDVGGGAGTQRADAAHGAPSVGERLEVQIAHLHAGVEVHAMLLEPALQRPHDRVVAVVACRLDDLQRRQVGEQAQEPQQVAAQFGRAVPGLETEGAAPQDPEVRGEEVAIEALVDAPGTQRLLAAQHQPDQVDAVLVAQPVGLGVDDVAVLDQPRPVVPRRAHPELERVLRHRLVGVVERRDVRQQLPHQLVGRAVHAAAAHREPLHQRPTSVQAAADRVLLEHVDLRTGQLGVADQVHGRGQRGDAATHEPGAARGARFGHRVLLFSGRGGCRGAGGCAAARRRTATSPPARRTRRPARRRAAARRAPPRARS